MPKRKKRDDEMVPLLTAAVEAARIEAGLTRPEAADRIGISRPHYNNIEAQRKYAKKAHVTRMAREFRVSMDDLIDFDKIAQDEAEDAA